MESFESYLVAFQPKCFVWWTTRAREKTSKSVLSRPDAWTQWKRIAVLGLKLNYRFLSLKIPERYLTAHNACADGRKKCWRKIASQLTPLCLWLIYRFSRFELKMQKARINQSSVSPSSKFRKMSCKWASLFDRRQPFIFSKELINISLSL